MCNGTIMTDDKRMEMLENHDFARTGLQKGNNVCSNCTKFPTAENFYKFVSYKTITAEVQRSQYDKPFCQIMAVVLGDIH